MWLGSPPHWAVRGQSGAEAVLALCSFELLRFRLRSSATNELLHKFRQHLNIVLHVHVRNNVTPIEMRTGLLGKLRDCFGISLLRNADDSSNQE